MAHAGSEKTPRGHVPARAGGRPLDDELGGYWHQIPTHTEMGEKKTQGMDRRCEKRIRVAKGHMRRSGRVSNLTT